MTTLDCLKLGIVNPATIAQKTRKKLPQVSAELLKLYHRIGEQFAKPLLVMEPLDISLTKAQAAIKRLHQGMNETDKMVLEHALQGILNHKQVAARIGLGEVVVRTSRAHMMHLAKLDSFKEVVRLVIFYEELKRRKKAAKKK